jgi:hypothetical protein
VAITPAVVVIAVVALALSEPAEAKGFKRAVLIGSDGRPVTVRGSERAFSGLLSAPGAREPLDGGYVRLFFVGPGEFPAAPARYYPQRRLARFRVRPTVLARIRYHGVFRGTITTAAALEPEVELAYDRASRRSPRPGDCYSFGGRWRGPWFRLNVA